MRFCPFWILGVVSVYATRRYVNGDFPLLTYSSKYTSILKDHFDDVSNRKLMFISEEIMSYNIINSEVNIYPVSDTWGITSLILYNDEIVISTLSGNLIFITLP